MTAIFWFRRDLRLEDNHGLYLALKENAGVIPLFIFDDNILSKLEDKDDGRVTFIHDEVLKINEALKELGSSLLVKQGDPVEIIEELVLDLPVDKVYVNHDYEPYARERDAQVAMSLKSKNIAFISCKDQVIFEKEDILKANGSPYSIYTPYMKQWKASYRPELGQAYDISPYRTHFRPAKPRDVPSLEDLGFRRSSLVFPDRRIDEGMMSGYGDTRDIPSLDGTSRLGLHLRFGTVSIRKVVDMACRTSKVFLNELIWREFYMMILWHYPHVASTSFKPAYERIQWQNKEQEFYAWCGGKTGYPIVDAGMRQLNATGFMHNRLRMITASFLTKLLLIDWRWGEAYFARRLLDFELASNNGGWQWSAGTGCDAAPYFRIFSPEAQMKKYDPKMDFINTWVPEWNTEQYPPPIVDYRNSRERALRIYRAALQ